jgi:hypothetical protein
MAEEPELPEDLESEDEQEGSEEKEDRPHCPNCWSGDLRYSHNRNWWDDILLSVLGMEVFRCRKCHKRFHARTEWEPPVRTSKK